MTVCLRLRQERTLNSWCREALPLEEHGAGYSVWGCQPADWPLPGGLSAAQRNLDSYGTS